jgi:hypothetical protein
MDGADFQRACDAYAAPAVRSDGSAPASGGTSSVIVTLLTILLPVAAGSLLTVSVDEIRQGAQQRFVQAAELRDAWNAFRDLIDTYLKKRQQGRSDGTLPEPAEIDALNRALDRKLVTIRAQHRRSPSVKRLRLLLEGQSGRRVADGWAGGEGSEVAGQRAQRVGQITTDMEQFDVLLQAVAAKLEHRIWLSWTL